MGPIAVSADQLNKLCDEIRAAGMSNEQLIVKLATVGLSLSIVVDRLEEVEVEYKELSAQVEKFKAMLN